MKRTSFMFGLVGCCVITAILGNTTGCGGGDADEAEGTCAIQGNVESFEASAPAARILAAVPAVVVYLTGPVSRNTTTDADGTFVFTGLTSGDYQLSFEHNGATVAYHTYYGQIATISLANRQRVELVNIRITGAGVNVWKMETQDLDESGEPIESDDQDGDVPTDLTGTWIGTDNGTYLVGGGTLILHADGNFVLSCGSGSSTGTYSVNAGVSPYHLDMTYSQDVIWNGGNVGRTFYGLCAVNGNTLTACWDPRARPDSFAYYGYHIWTRQ